MTPLRLGPLAHDGGDGRPILMLVAETTDPERRERLSWVVREATDAGVDWILVRHDGATREALRDTARLLNIHRAVVGCLIFVNGSALAAREAYANGIHLSAHVGAMAATRQRAPHLWVGRSISLDNLDEVGWRVSEKPDYLIAEKASSETLKALQTACEAAHSLPVLAAGNMSPETVTDYLDTGAAGVVISLMQEVDPRFVAEAYRNALDSWHRKTRTRAN